MGPSTLVTEFPSAPTVADHDLLELIQEELRVRIGDRKYALWFGANARIDILAREIRVTAPTQFAADWIGKHFSGSLNESANKYLPGKRPLTIGVHPKASPHRPSDCAARGDANGGRVTHDDARDRGVEERSTEPRTIRSAPPPAPREGVGSCWRRFEDFLVAPPNRLAYESARQVADVDGNHLRLLFLHGSCGVGKTHLLQSICQRLKELQPSAKVRYVTAEQFTNEYIAAIREGSIERFRKQTRRLDLLAIDDIHFLASKTATQAECQHTIDAIGFHGARMVLASDAHPRQVAKFSAALVSRFLSGMVVRVDDPDRATRLALAERFALRRGFSLAPAAIATIIDRTGTSIRELEGAVMTVAAFAALEGDSIGRGQVLVERALGRSVHSRVGRPVRIAEILQAVCATTGVEREDLVGPGRHRRVVTARGLAAHLAREMTTLSFPEIASALGRSSHSTIHAAAARFRALVDESRVIAARTDHLTAGELIERTRREVLRVQS